MFESFPKTRNPLPLEYQRIYEQMYKDNRSGNTSATSLAQKMERWLHHKVASDIYGISGYKTLEIGAGTLNQIAYEKNLDHYDVIEPFEALYKDSPNLCHIRKVYRDIAEVVEACGVCLANSRGGGDYMIESSRVQF